MLDYQGVISVSVRPSQAAGSVYRVVWTSDDLVILNHVTKAHFKIEPPFKRGDVWTVAGGGDHAGKPRPAVIVQDDHFDATKSKLGSRIGRISDEDTVRLNRAILVFLGLAG